MQILLTNEKHFKRNQRNFLVSEEIFCVCWKSCSELIQANTYRLSLLYLNKRKIYKNNWKILSSSSATNHFEGFHFVQNLSHFSQQGCYEPRWVISSLPEQRQPSPCCGSKQCPPCCNTVGNRTGAVAHFTNFAMQQTTKARKKDNKQKREHFLKHAVLTLSCLLSVLQQVI